MITPMLNYATENIQMKNLQNTINYTSKVYNFREGPMHCGPSQPNFSEGPDPHGIDAYGPINQSLLRPKAASIKTNNKRLHNKTRSN